jgi:hypothetical protein
MAQEVRQMERLLILAQAIGRVKVKMPFVGRFL